MIVIDSYNFNYQFQLSCEALVNSRGNLRTIQTCAVTLVLYKYIIAYFS